MKKENSSSMCAQSIPLFDEFFQCLQKMKYFGVFSIRKTNRVCVKNLDHIEVKFYRGSEEKWITLRTEID